MIIELKTPEEERAVCIALQCYVSELLQDNTDPEDFLIVEPFLSAGETLIQRYFPEEEDRKFFLGEDGEIHES